MNNMTDLNWPFPSLQYPLTPPKPPEYLDCALSVAAEIKIKVVPEDALL